MSLGTAPAVVIIAIDAGPMSTAMPSTPDAMPRRAVTDNDAATLVMALSPVLYVSCGCLPLPAETLHGSEIFKRSMAFRLARTQFLMHFEEYTM
jgi:hypothetical protein